MSEAPHARQRLALANAAPRCGAKRRDGGSCLSPAMRNGRCRIHGGKSTGARTSEGAERARKARWQHGYYSAEAKSQRAEARQGLRLLRQLLALGL